VTDIYHFTYGLLTPLLAYVMSCVGSALGLLCTARARGVTGAARVRWLTLAAVSIGGTGIWVMHFIAMLGFSVSGSAIRYDVGLTMLSMAIAVVVVGIGLLIVGFGGERLVPVLGGGTITGLGVASMHYTGMAAVQVRGVIHYDDIKVAASIVIAVVAATAALLFALRVRGPWATGAAALIMGVAVSGMHYTAMAAMSVQLDDEHATLAGANAFQFLLPLIIGISLVAGALLGVIALSPNEDELRAEAEMMERIANLATVGGPRPREWPRQPAPRGESVRRRESSYFERR
jgi:NO-binding membrane sensor protein with MHYT domain